MLLGDYLEYQGYNITKTFGTYASPIDKYYNN